MHFITFTRHSPAKMPLGYDPNVFQSYLVRIGSVFGPTNTSLLKIFMGVQTPILTRYDWKILEDKGWDMEFFQARDPSSKGRTWRSRDVDPQQKHGHAAPKLSILSSAEKHDQPGYEWASLEFHIHKFSPHSGSKLSLENCQHFNL